MRAAIATSFSGFALAAAAAQAAPLVPLRATAVQLGAVPSIELVGDSCGRGWHRTHWRGHWSYCHWGHCAPIRDPYGGWDAGWNHPY